jgi:hypothetical protein
MHPSVRQVVVGRSRYSHYDFALDFKNGFYKPTRNSSLLRDPLLVPGVSYTRAGAKSRFGTNALYTAAANVPLITNEGYWAEQAFTNKCTNHNATPNGSLTNVTKSGDAAATLTEVDDTAALAAAGLSGLCTNGKVFKLDNSAGSVFAVASVGGATGNINAHTLTAYVRGSGSCRIQENWNGNGANFTASASYIRRSSGSVIPGNAGSLFSVIANPGAILYFTLNQMVESGLTGPIIVTAGAAATSALDNMQFTAPIPLDGEDWMMLVAANCPLASSTSENLITISDGSTNNRISWARDLNGNTSAAQISGGAAQASVATASNPQSAVGRGVFAVRHRAGKLTPAIKNSAGGVALGVDTTAALFPVGMNRIDIGNRIGALFANAPIEFVGFRRGVFSDADLISALSVP